jgi:hypothetical protein
MPFYAHPTDQISPGDIFPSIPISVSLPPLRIVRKTNYNPPKQFADQDLRRLFTLPVDVDKVPDSHLETKAGEETIAATRVGPVIFLSWGSQVEGDEREMEQAKGKSKGKAWLAAPIYPLGGMQDEVEPLEEPDPHRRAGMREIVRRNQSHNYMYLPPLPESVDGREHYIDFRKICPVGIGFFVESKRARLATLTEDSLNVLFSRLMWFFTRAEYFFRPIICNNCGSQVPIDIRFEGQNFDAEPWEQP